MLCIHGLIATTVTTTTAPTTTTFTSSKINTPTTSTTPRTYFGVDADDEEAVRQKQKELAEESLTRIFGKDFDIEDFNFSVPDEIEHKKNEIHESLQKAWKWFVDKIPKKRDSHTE